MHILEIPSFFPPYGGEFCIEQAKALRDQGHEVRILACVQLGMTVTPKLYFTARCGRWWETIEGVEVYRSFMRGCPRNTKYNQQHWCKVVMSMYDDYVAQYGTPDALHAHCCQWGGVAASMISDKSGVPYYITEHLSAILFEEGFGKGWTRDVWAKDLLKATYEEASCVIPVSEELTEGLTPLFGRNYKYKVVSNIIDVDFFSFRNRTPLNGRPFRYCCLARADIYGKGYDVLAEAFKDIDNAELHIAGRNTQGEAMKQLFCDFNNVYLHGELDKRGVRELLYQCDALVLPSRSEAQPLVVLEAMSTGIPVVSTECVPMAERVEGACIITPIGDAKAFAEGMKDIRKIAPSARFHDAVCAIASPATVAKEITRVFNEKRQEDE